MPPEKNIKWEKPIIFEKRAYSSSKMFKDKLGGSDMTVNSECSVINVSESDLEPAVEEEEGKRKSRTTKEASSPATASEDSNVEKSESSSFSVKGTGENEEKDIDDEPRDKSKVSVRFKEYKDTLSKRSLVSIIEETTKTKKNTDYEK